MTVYLELSLAKAKGVLPRKQKNIKTQEHPASTKLRFDYGTSENTKARALWCLVSSTPPLEVRYTPSKEAIVGTHTWWKELLRNRREHDKTPYQRGIRRAEGEKLKS